VATNHPVNFLILILIFFGVANFRHFSVYSKKKKKKKQKKTQKFNINTPNIKKNKFHFFFI